MYYIFLLVYLFITPSQYDYMYMWDIGPMSAQILVGSSGPYEPETGPISQLLLKCKEG